VPTLTAAISCATTARCGGVRRRLGGCLGRTVDGGATTARSAPPPTTATACICALPRRKNICVLQYRNKGLRTCSNSPFRLSCEFYMARTAMLTGDLPACCSQPPSILLFVHLTVYAVTRVAVSPRRAGRAWAGRACAGANRIRNDEHAATPRLYREQR